MNNENAVVLVGSSWKNVPTQTISAGGVDFAYRELGKSSGGTPVVST